MKTLLTNSYIKHIDLTRNKYREKRDNHFHGVLDEDGTIVASFINSHNNPSILEGRVYRLLCFRLLIGRASGYPRYPNGAPYYKFGFVTKRNSYGLLLGQRGFVTVKLKRTKV